MQKIVAPLLGLCLALLTGCKSGPQITVCILDPDAGLLQCARPDESTFELSLDQAANYSCMSPDDMEKLLLWISQRCKK